MSKITVRILGTAAGVPTRERAHTAIHISYHDEKKCDILFDCGENAQRQLLLAARNIMKINNVFITHWHGDHCLGLPGLVDTMGFEGRQKPLNVYAPEARRIKKCLGFTHSMGKFKVIPHKVPARGRKLKKLFDTERFSVGSIPVKHSKPAVAYTLIEKEKVGIDLRKAISLGLPEKSELYQELKTKGRIKVNKRTITLKEISIVEKGKKIVYSGDTEICPNLRKIVHGADLLIQDATYFEMDPPQKHYKHASLPDVLKMAEEEKVKRVILTHISRKYQDTDSMRLLIKDYPNIELAEDFTEVVI